MLRNVEDQHVNRKFIKHQLINTEQVKSNLQIIINYLQLRMFSMRT